MKLPFAKNTDIVIQDLGKELLVYNLITHKACALNETAKIIFNHCDGKASFADLKSRYGYSDDLIYLGLDQLKEQGVIDNYESKFKGIARREVVRRVGLASMIALPVIAGLVAPPAASAQSFSNLALGQTCTSSNQCSSSAPNCAPRVPSTGTKRCCAGADSRFDTGGVVNSCSGGNCSSATFTCQDDANDFCCSNQATASCTGNSCACRCT